jgi:hypothetical protein
MRPLPAPAAIPASARETRPKPSSTTSVLCPGGRPPPILPSWNAVWTRRAASAASASWTTLRDRDHVDPRGGERREHARGDAGRPRHPAAHHGDHRDAVTCGHAVDEAGLELVAERGL